VAAQPKLAPRPAATIVLLRDAARGPEVFMLRRTLEAKFVAGAYVFPGGKVDTADGDARIARRVVGLNEDAANRRLGLASGGLAYWVAAARECFEEAGILLAVDASGRRVDPARAEALGHLRAPLNAGELAFAEFLEREDLYVPASDMAWLAHWITPVGRPRRFDARFFVALAPPGQDGSHDEGETIANVWIRPRDALDRAARGEIELVFATQNTLGDLSRFATAAEAFAHVQTIEVELNAACWGLAADGAKSLHRRSDPAYFEIHWSDPGETGETSIALVPGVAKRLDEYVTRIIAPNPGMMTGPGTNAYLVGREDLAVIDPGPDIESHRQALLAAGAGRIRWILCTHTHVDHSPGAAALARATGAQVLGRPAPAGGSQDRTFAPDRVLAHGDRVELGGATLRAIHTPGHASNHLCYLLEETRMLFTGDHVMQGSTVVINPPDGNMLTYLQSLESVIALDAAILAPGHGYLIGDPAKEIRRLIAHRLKREAKVLAALPAEGDASGRMDDASVEELVSRVYDDVSPRLHPVASRSLTAHLDKLVEEGRVHMHGGRYRLASPAQPG
jgi:glyoxylase-like metal-dependent hydrolase (beta-lactamase superfamily II)/8-oxo-dGTP pyrophosphatase MutT (NUDIX family)